MKILTIHNSYLGEIVLDLFQHIKMVLKLEVPTIGAQTLCLIQHKARQGTPKKHSTCIVSLSLRTFNKKLRMETQNNIQGNIATLVHLISIALHPQWVHSS